MFSFYQQTAVFRFLKVAEMWGQETNTDMWTIARIMAMGTQSSPNENPLIIHHISMLDAEGNHDPKGGFRSHGLLDALNTLIHDAPARPIQTVIKGLQDMCISKEFFRLWCMVKFPLPQFWFTEKERTTFSEAEKVQIERSGNLKWEELEKGNINFSAFEFKPSIYGFSVDLKKIYENYKSSKINLTK